MGSVEEERKIKAKRHYREEVLGLRPTGFPSDAILDQREMIAALFKRVYGPSWTGYYRGEDSDREEDKITDKDEQPRSKPHDEIMTWDELCARMRALCRIGLC